MAKDPKKFVEVITTRLSAKRETLVEALRGAVTARHSFVLDVMLARDVEYRDLGADYFDKRDRLRLVARLTRKLDNLGYKFLPKAA